MILASASPRREKILRDAGLEVEVFPQNIDETTLPEETPPELVERLARLKAEACAASRATNDPIVAADTIVWTDAGDVLGKPHDADDARRMLASLSGKTHYVSTGVAILVGDVKTSFVETTEVEFFELSEEQIDAYLATGEPYDKAGAYAIQDKGRLLVRGIRGDYYNVVGLPIARLVREIARLDGKERRHTGTNTFKEHTWP